MSFRIDERATDFTEIDRFESGVGWIAHPEEKMQRASHALEVDGEVWIIDPVDAEGLDDLLAEFGEVAGVVVTLDRHKRDAAAIANRHDVHVYLPRFFEGVAEELDAPIVRFETELADTGLEARTIVDNRFWQEVALYNPRRRDARRSRVRRGCRLLPRGRRATGRSPDATGCAAPGCPRRSQARAGTRRSRSRRNSQRRGCTRPCPLWIPNTGSAALREDRMGPATIWSVTDPALVAPPT